MRIYTPTLTGMIFLFLLTWFVLGVISEVAK